MENLQANLTLIQQRLAAASDGKYPVPKLIAVTKTHPAEDILPLQNLGVTDIGENKVQEIMEKLPALEKNFRIHLIGRLQSNKVKYIIDHVCLIHSVDRLSLAQEIDRQAQKHNRVMPVLIQVSPCGEAQKGGLPPEELIPFLRTVSQLPGLSVQGLMAVMPNTPDTVLLDKLFADMRTLFERARAEAIPGIEMKELSMGMSHDYELAARHGATMVRIGSALMGARDYGPKGNIDGGCSDSSEHARSWRSREAAWRFSIKPRRNFRDSCRAASRRTATGAATAARAAIARCAIKIPPSRSRKFRRARSAAA